MNKKKAQKIKKIMHKLLMSHRYGINNYELMQLIKSDDIVSEDMNITIARGYLTNGKLQRVAIVVEPKKPFSYKDFEKKSILINIPFLEEYNPERLTRYILFDVKLVDETGMIMYTVASDARITDGPWFTLKKGGVYESC